MYDVNAVLEDCILQHAGEDTRLLGVAVPRSPFSEGNNGQRPDQLMRNPPSWSARVRYCAAVSSFLSGVIMALSAALS